MKRLLVTGGNGLLGGKVLQAAGRKLKAASMDIQDRSLLQGNWEYFRADIRDQKAVRETILGFRPDWVVHAAAYTDVDGCETNRDLAWNVNVTGAENVALACREAGARMVHLSTDYIFDGRNGPYDEDDPAHPISHYGRSKWESELMVRAVLKDAIVARTMVLYGFLPHVRINFATWLVHRLRSHERVSIVTDQMGNPTLADDLAPALLHLLREGAAGVYHAAGPERISRFDFATMLADVFGLNASLITPVKTDLLNLPAPRPLNSGLNTRKIESLGVRFRPVRDALREMKDQMDSTTVSA